MYYDCIHKLDAYVCSPSQEGPWAVAYPLSPYMAMRNGVWAAPGIWVPYGWLSALGALLGCLEGAHWALWACCTQPQGFLPIWHLVLVSKILRIYPIELSDYTHVLLSSIYVTVYPSATNGVPQALSLSDNYQLDRNWTHDLRDPISGPNCSAGGNGGCRRSSTTLVGSGENMKNL